MARNSRASAARSSRGRSPSRGRRSDRGSSRGYNSSKRGDSDYMMVGNVTLTKKSNDNEEEILDNMAAAIEDGLPLQEVLQLSGLQLWMQFYWPKEGTMEFDRKDKILLSFKEPHEKAPDFNLATAAFNKNS